ncbi:transcription antitermination factor NusB [Helicobacter canis]|uniref:Transcription antitermination protein NusB n=1 Tax=Helicobacter canis TaxID=29419 RepID=A0A5M9QTA8_9HELI|nr:transcription antitermination factor NusB [Helicobacter canis]KAA8711548.1 transcription antitermination factor NusB [Helicobacter canis]
MATRTQAREAVVGLLYAYMCGNGAVLESAPTMLTARKIKNKQQDFALGLLRGVIERFDSLGEELEQHLKEWEFERLGQMEKSILRLGAYEILYTQTDSPIIINEAIELAKMYGDDNAPRLINGVLDALSRAQKQET